jgi:hypothetical protein
MTVASDDFAGLAAAANLSTRSPWVQKSGVLQGEAAGGRIRPENPGVDSVYRYEGSAAGNDQLAECVVAWTGSGGECMGPGIRLSATGSGYGLIISQNGQAFLNLYTNGVYAGTTLFTSSAGAIASGSLMRVQAIGSTLKVFDDGVEIFSGTDSTHTAGQWGLIGYSNSTTIYADNWSASDGQTTVVSVVSRRRRRRRHAARGADRVPAAWSDVRFSALGWFDRDLWRVASAGGSSFNKTTAESFALADAQTESAAFPRARAESVAITDAQSGALLAGNTFNVSRSETFALSDAQAETAIFVRSAAESVAIADAQSKSAAFTRAAAESVALSDAQGRTAAFSRATAESVALADAQIETAALGRTVAESLSLSDSQAESAVFARSTAEAVALADTQASSTAGLFAVTAAESFGLADSASAIVVLAPVAKTRPFGSADDDDPRDNHPRDITDDELLDIAMALIASDVLEPTWTTNA